MNNCKSHYDQYINDFEVGDVVVYNDSTTTSTGTILRKQNGLCHVKWHDGYGVTGEDPKKILFTSRSTQIKSKFCVGERVVYVPSIGKVNNNYVMGYVTHINDVPHSYHIKWDDKSEILLHHDLLDNQPLIKSVSEVIKSLSRPIP